MSEIIDCGHDPNQPKTWDGPDGRRVFCETCGTVRLVRAVAEPAAEATNEDWIREIVNNYGADLYRTGLVHELAAEVTSRLAEAYEEGHTDGLVRHHRKR